MVPYPVSFKLAKALVRQLDEIAERELRSRNATVAAALKEFARRNRDAHRKQQTAQRRSK
jgi:metal-responsive CopG/Arc/MetJ family transcriptional regulator